MENQESISNFKEVEKYDRFFADTKQGRVDYWVIDINTMAVEGTDHYVVMVRYHLQSRDIITIPLIDINIFLEEKKVVKF